ncbi:MAG: TonB-dependent receptor [Lacisediminimonas sp.]|nr:TonB-dependent receptor [Lacisediminimonas sp.]
MKPTLRAPLRTAIAAVAAAFVLLPSTSAAQSPPEATLDAVQVDSSIDRPIGIAESANQGTVTARQLENRPRARTGDLLEAVPGVVVTQHSGDGKANQYFARGFNLDHGTDFRTTVLGMPVNMPSHAHGQGYSDLNFLIPELISTIQYKKGTYFAEEGNFSAVGAAAFDYVRSLPRGLFSLELGSHRYRRAVLANSGSAGAGTLLYAVEAVGNDGPWEVAENYKRFNGLLSWNLRAGNDELRIAAMTLQSSWRATDQVPQRALVSGVVGRYGSLDASDGGDTARSSVSADWQRRYANGALHANAFLVRSRLNLFSNFTLFAKDPVNGDQFNQAEQRLLGGVNLDRAWNHKLGRFESETTVGLQLRQDRLSPVGLYTSVARQRLATTREDRVVESSAGLFASNTTRWTPWLRTVAGVRNDRARFRVNSSNPADSGSVDDAISSPKFSAIFTPAEWVELYLNWGRGFHSNDARGINNAVNRSTPLVPARGREAGVRIDGLVRGLQTTLALWELDLASELVFVGDAGTTQASRPSHRRGIELSNVYRFATGWSADLDLAWSRARFTDGAVAGPYIPGAVNRTASLGITAESGRWSGGMRVRHVGGRPLVEDNSVRSPSSTLVNAKFGYALARDVKLTLEVLNLLNRKVSDIDYYYESQLRNEGAPVADIHTHPAEMRALRVGMSMRF